jgi:hypothetical protein
MGDQHQRKTRTSGNRTVGRAEDAAGTLGSNDRLVAKVDGNIFWALCVGLSLSAS